MVRKTILLLGWIALVCCCAYGQVASKLTKYADLRGVKPMMCSYGSGNDCVIYTSGNTVPKLIGVGGAGTYQYSLPQIITTAGTIGYQVRDMHVVGNTLYLGGMLCPPVLEEPPATMRMAAPTDTTGFIARVSLDSISMFGLSNIKFQICQLVTLRCVNRFAVQHEGGDTLIGMLATQTAGGRPVLALMNAESSWSLKIHNISDEAEIMTDITFVPKYLVLTSRLDADSSRFCIRYGKIDEAFYSPFLFELNNRHEFSIDDASDACVCAQRSCHYDDAEIRVVGMADSNHFTVAYESKQYYQYQYPDNFSKYVSLFHVRTVFGGTPLVSAAKTISFAPDVNNQFIDIRCDRISNEVALLCRMANPGRFASQIIRFSWSPTPDYIHCAETESFTSIDLKGGSMLACGARTDSDRLISYYQNTNYDPWQCIEGDAVNTCKATHLPMAQSYTVLFDSPSPGRSVHFLPVGERVLGERLMGTPICTTNEANE